MKTPLVRITRDQMQSLERGFEWNKERKTAVHYAPTPNHRLMACGCDISEYEYPRSSDVSQVTCKACLRELEGK